MAMAAKYRKDKLRKVNDFLYWLQSSHIVWAKLTVLSIVRINRFSPCIFVCIFNIFRHCYKIVLNFLLFCLSFFSLSDFCSFSTLILFILSMYTSHAIKYTFIGSTSTIVSWKTVWFIVSECWFKTASRDYMVPRRPATWKNNRNCKLPLFALSFILPSMFTNVLLIFANLLF